MTKYKYSRYFLKSMGLNDSEINLVISRNNEYAEGSSLSSDSRTMNGQKYNGLGDVDKANAESFRNEFGNVVNPDPNRALKKYMK